MFYIWVSKFITIMRLKIFFGILVVLFALQSCKDKNKIVSFNLETNDPVFFIPLGDSLLTDTILGNEGISLQSEDFKFSSYEKFKSNTVIPAELEDVEAYNLILTLDSGISNLSFMKDLKVFIGNGTGKDIELISVDFPGQIDTLGLLMRPTTDEWLNIMRKDKYYFRSDFTQVSAIPDSVALRYKMSFRLKGNPTKD
jgi:hypothetical protein